MRTAVITRRTALLGGVLAILSSCVLGNEAAPPFVLSRPECYIEERAGYYVFAGVEFDFLNTGSKSIAEIDVSFMIYDAETQRSPCAGSNIIRVRFRGSVQAGEKKRFIVSLDPYIYAAPRSPYIIDFFYIPEIIYQDGSTWADKAGVYYTGG